MQITFTNSRRETCVVFITQEMAEKLIDTLYPDKGLTGISKGYITLVNFICKEVK